MWMRQQKIQSIELAWECFHMSEFECDLWQWQNKSTHVAISPDGKCFIGQENALIVIHRATTEQYHTPHGGKTTLAPLIAFIIRIWITHKWNLSLTYQAYRSLLLSRPWTSVDSCWCVSPLCVCTPDRYTSGLRMVLNNTLKPGSLNKHPGYLLAKGTSAQMWYDVISLHVYSARTIISSGVSRI